MTDNSSDEHGVPDEPRRIVVQRPGYERERLPGDIFILRLHDARSESVDAWYEDCNKLMSRWLPGQHLRYLHDIRAAESVTPHAMDRVARVLRRMRNTPVTDGHGAIVLNNGVVASLLATFFKRRPHANWQIRFFDKEDLAVRWLAE
jgi:hypothetical protein